MATFADLKTAVTTTAGIDTDATTAGVWINERLREAVARAKWNMAEITVGPTVAGTVRYAISDDIIDLDELLVAAVPYQRTSTRSLYRLRTGQLARNTSDGVFAPTFSSAGVESIDLYPAPEESGLAITGLAAMKAVTLTGTETPGIPEDLHPGLRDGAVATGLSLTEERHDSAQVFQARFDAMVAELTRRKNSRIGSGPTQVMVAGIHFRPV